MDGIVTSPRSHQASEALGLWEPRRTLTLEAARQHTRRVKRFRFCLLGMAAILAGGLIYQFFTEASTTVFPTVTENESVKMVSPRYSGRTDDGLPYYLVADTATREVENSDDVSLINPVLEFTRDDGSESSYVEALTGQYNDVTKVLILQQNVTLDTDDGYHCETEHARIMTKAKRIDGERSIRCTGNFGLVSGNQYAIEDNYSVFIFKDGMSGLIEQDPAANNAGSENFGFRGKDPVDVKAKIATYRGGTTSLSGDVVVKQDNATLSSDNMIIYRNEQKSAASGSLKLGEIKEITAKGNFRYKTPKNDITGNEGVYQRNINVITISGDVHAVQANGNSAKSDKLIYNTNNESIRFIGDCNGSSCSSFTDGRTQFTLPGTKNN